MKVAICYSGQPRNCSSTYQNHKKYLYDFFKANNIETFTFAHFWSSLQKDDTLSQTRINYDNDNVEVFRDLWRPIKLLEEKQRMFENNYIPDPRFPHPVQNIFSMFYSIYKSWELASQFQTEQSLYFDLVIRIRSDLYFQGKPFNARQINKLNSIYIISDSYRHTSYSVGDIFAIGPSHCMKIYMNLYNNLDKMITKGAAVNPECLLGYWLQYCSVPVSFVPLNHILFRDVGSMYAKRAFLMNTCKQISLKFVKNLSLI